MGGQACVFYGAAEFSRDTDLAVLASSENLTRLKKALDDLQAEVIAVPPFAATYLRRGHAVHFRCHHGDAAGMRVDVMTKMRTSRKKMWHVVDRQKAQRNPYLMLFVPFCGYSSFDFSFRFAFKV